MLVKKSFACSLCTIVLNVEHFAITDTKQNIAAHSHNHIVNVKSIRIEEIMIKKSYL